MHVTNYYDRTLQHITGCSYESATVSEGLLFLEYLFFILSSYPQIESLYPPGTLAFTINGKRPTDFTVLRNGDQIFFAVVFSLNN